MITKTDLKIISNEDNMKNNSYASLPLKDIVLKFKKLDNVVNMMDILINKKQNDIYNRYKLEEKKYKQKLQSIDNTKKILNKIKQNINIEIKKKELFNMVFKLLNNIRIISTERKKLLYNIICENNNLKQVEKNIEILRKLI